MNNLTLLPGYTLKELLADQCQLNRSKLKKILAEKELLGLKKIIDYRYQDPRAFNLPLDLLNHKEINPHYLGPHPAIIYMDDHFLAINKPAGIHGHSLRYLDQSNCLSFLRMKGHSEVLEIDKTQRERGMLYRLDAGTSGILVFARTEEIFNQVRKVKGESFTFKYYLALTRHRPSMTGKLTLNFTSKGRRGEKVEASHDSDGQSGTCFIDILDSSENIYLVGVRLYDGLRHQIRATLSYLNAPILGDKHYGGEEADRIALHAYCYGLESDEGREYYFKAPLDLFFNSLLDLNGLSKVFEDKICVSEGCKLNDKPSLG